MSPERRQGRTERERKPLGIEEIAQIATEVALETGGHVPTLVVEGSKGSTVCYLEGFPYEQRGKRLLMAKTGFMVARKGVVGFLEGVSLVSEAWLSVAEEGRLPDVPPSEDPNRREVLIVNRCDVKAKKMTSVLFEMLRDGEGSLVDLVRVDPEEEAGVRDQGKAETKSPLMDAFVEGFQRGMRGRGR